MAVNLRTLLPRPALCILVQGWTNMADTTDALWHLEMYVADPFEAIWLLDWPRLYIHMMVLKLYTLVS